MHVAGQQFDYSADSLPQDAGWDIFAIFCDPGLWLEGGWFHQHVELCDGYPPPGGQGAVYRRSMDDVSGVEHLFVEWRVVTDAPRSEIPWGGGAILAAANLAGVRYTYFIASDQVKLNRDNTLPIVFVDLQPGVAHTFRLEQHGTAAYVWRIDGEVVDAGVPEGPLTCCTLEISWTGKAAWVGNTTSWDYIRYGALTASAPGDTNCDGLVNLFDIDPFIVALFDPVGFNTQQPACSLLSADLDGDLRINFFDIDPFVDCVLGACP